MTHDEAVRLARAEAERLGFPWEPGNVTATRRHVWPLPAWWRIISETASPHSRTTMRVSERRGAAFPVGILYPAAPRALTKPLGTHLWRRLLVPAVLAGGLAYLVSSAVLRWPSWAVFLVTAGWAVIAPIVATSIRQERSVDLNQK